MITLKSSLRKHALLFLMSVLILNALWIGGGLAHADTPTNYYVANNGSDSWSGMLDAPNSEGTDGPFATIEHAKNVIRSQIAGGMTSDITVYVWGGEYSRSSALAFTQEDSGVDGFDVIYQNYPGEQPILTYASPLNGTEWQPYSGDIYVMNVGTRRFNSLYENGVAAVPARTPNNGYAAARAKVTTDEYRTFGFFPADVPVLPEEDQLDLKINIWSGEDHTGNKRWQNQLCSVATPIDYTNNQMTVGCNVSYSIGAGSAYYLTGALAFLDQPGEFYLNSQTGDLYYWKRSSGNMDDQLMQAPDTTKAIEFVESSGRAVHNITLDGFEIWGTDSDLDFNIMLFNAAVKLQNANAITIRNNWVHDVGLSGIGIYNFGHDNMIYGNKIVNTGFHGVETRPAANEPTAPIYNITISNNDVEHVATVIHYGSGINGGSDDSIVRNNRIVDAPRFGIGFGGYRSIFQYNDISDAMNESQDGGAMYTRFDNAGGTVETGTIVDSNAVHDTNITYDYGFGIYLDDQSDSNTLSNNLLYANQTIGNSGPGVFRGSFVLKGIGTRLVNNYVIDSIPDRGTVYTIDSQGAGSNPDAVSKDQYVRNNVFYNSMGPGGAVFAGSWGEGRFALSDYNTFYNNGGPISVSLNGLPVSPNHTWEEWTSFYLNKYDNYSKLEDPMFVDSDNHDYRLSYNSPARAVGTQPIDFERIGLTSDFRYASDADPLKQLFIHTDTTNSGESLIKLSSGGTSQLAVTARTINGGLVDDLVASGASVTYSSSDLTGTNVATVSSSGVVTAQHTGLAEVTATVTRDTQSFSIPIYVAVDDTVSSITLKSSYNVVTTGTTSQLHLEGLSSLHIPLDLTSTATYTSSNDGVATIDENGVVTGVSDGEATITATVSGLTSSVSISTLSAENSLKSIDLTMEDRVLEVGQSTAVHVTAASDAGTEMDLSNATISYSMDQSGIATLSDSTSDPTLTTTGDGRANLTVIVTMNGKSLTKTLRFVSYTDTVSDVPAPWQVSNYYISNPDTGMTETFEPGFVKYDSETDEYRMESSGKDLYNHTDSTTFMYQEVTHDPAATAYSISARVKSLEQSPGGASTAVGVMIRDANTADSKEINFRIQFDGSGAVTYRTADGGESGYKISVHPGFNGQVKLTRMGDVIIAYYKTATSADWLFFGNFEIPMDGDILVGITGMSGNYAFPMTALVDQVTVASEPLMLHSVSLKTDKPYLITGETSQAIVEGYSSEYGSTMSLEGASITYSSSNSSVATIDSDGMITHVGVGDAIITASVTLNGSTVIANLPISVGGSPIVGISLLHTATSVAHSGTVQANLEAVLTDGSLDTVPSSATVTYSSSNPTVASVDASGTIRGEAYGLANITANVVYAGSTYTSQIMVVVNNGTLYSEGWENGVDARWQESGSPEISSTQKRSGDSSMWIKDANSQVFDNSTIRNINGIQEIWFYDDGTTSQDLLINSDWVISGFGPIYNSDHYISKDLIRGQAVQASSFTRSKGWHQVVYDYMTTPGQLDVYIDGSLINHRDVLNGHDLLGFGDYLTNNGKGINAYFDDIAIYEVETNVAATGISLNKSNFALNVGRTDLLIATVSPSDASNQNVFWTSSDAAVASVDANGTVTGVAAGTAVITATTEDGGFTAASTVTVIIPAIGVALDKNEVTLVQGLSDVLTATVTPSDATNQSVSWSSSDTSVATVSPSGEVTAVGEGIAIITATTDDGNYTASCMITVPTGIIILDNTTADSVGDWTATTDNANYFGSDYLVNGGSRGSDTVTWTPNITTAGEYEVYYWLPDGTKDNAPNARFTIYYEGGSRTYNVNEGHSPSGQWVLLGTQIFTEGTTGSVVVDNSVKKTVMVDAMKWVLVD